MPVSRYIPSITDHFGRRIDAADDNFETYRADHNHASVLSENGGRRIRITGPVALDNIGTLNTALGTYPSDHEVVNNRGTQIPIIANNKTFRFEGADPSFNIDVDNVHMHIFNSTIFFFNSDDVGREGNDAYILGLSSTGGNNVAVTVDTGIAGNRVIGLHNCTILQDNGEQGNHELIASECQFSHCTDVSYRFGISNPHRQDHNFVGGAIVDGFDYDAGPLSNEALGGFRFAGLFLRGIPQQFDEFSATKQGFTFQPGADNTRLPTGYTVQQMPNVFTEARTDPVNDLLDGPRGTAGQTLSEVSTLHQIDGNASLGLMYPSPGNDTTVQGFVFGTQTDEVSSKHLTSVHYSPRFFTSGLLTEGSDGVYFNIKTTVNFNSSLGYFFIQDPLTGDPNKYQFISNDDGYLEGSFDFENMSQSDSADTERRDLFITTHLWEQSPIVGQAPSGSLTATTFNRNTNGTRFTYTTNVNIMSPFGTYTEKREFSESENYRAADADWIEGMPIVDRFDPDSDNPQNNRVDAPDIGMTHYAGVDVAARITTVKNKFTSTGSVTLTDIAALYKIALTEADHASDTYTEEFIDDWVNVDDSTIWDISGNATYNSIVFDPELTSEYEFSFDDNEFAIRALNIVEETDANHIVTRIKCRSISFEVPTNQRFTIADNIELESTATMDLDPRMDIGSATIITGDRFNSFGNSTFTGTTVMSHSHLNFETGDVLSEVTAETTGDGTLAIEGSTVSDSSSFTSVDDLYVENSTVDSDTTFNAAGDFFQGEDEVIDYDVEADGIRWNNIDPTMAEAPTGNIITGGVISGEIVNNQLMGGNTYNITNDNDTDITNLTVGTIGGTGTATIEVDFGVVGRDAFRTANSGVANLTILLLTEIVEETLTIESHSTLNGYFAVVTEKGTGNPETITTTGLATSTTALTAGTDISYTLSSHDGWEDGDMIHVYVKYNSDISSQEVYQEIVRTHTFGGGNVSFAVPNAVASVLFNDIEDPSSDVDIDIFTNHTPVKTTVPTNLIDVSSSAGMQTELDLDQFQSQGLAILISNEEDYFDIWFANRATTTDPLLSFGAANASIWNTDILGFGTDQVHNNFRIQQLVTNWLADTGATNTFVQATEDRTGAVEVLSREAQQASLQSVILAVETGIDNSTTATTVDNVDNKISYAISNGNRTSPDGAIANSLATPKEQEYDDSTDYTGIGGP